MKQKRQTQTYEEVIAAVDEDIYNFVMASMKKFEGHPRGAYAMIMLFAYATMQLHAITYGSATDQGCRDAVVDLGRRLAPMLHKVFMSEHPEDAWEIVSYRDVPRAFPESVKH